MSEDQLFRAILVVLSVAMFVNHRIRGTQFPKGDAVRGTIEFGLPAAACLWATSLILYSIGFHWFSYSIPLPASVRWTGVTVMVLCIPLSTWVYRTLGTHFSMKLQLLADHQLVRDGPYRYVRHPMYTPFFLCAIATILISAHIVVAVTGIATALFMVLRIKNEEAMLQERFGDHYRDYMEETGELFPKLL